MHGQITLEYDDLYSFSEHPNSNCPQYTKKTQTNKQKKILKRFPTGCMK